MIDFNYTLIIQFLNFLVLLILLNILLFKPILKVIGKREETISSLSERAEKAEEDATKFERLYDEGIRKHRVTALKGREVVISEAHSASLSIIEGTRKDLAGDLAGVRDQIERESREVFDSLRMDIDRLSTEAVQKILRRSVS
jgi:F-type H+-transporting ATPase subunit b